MDVQLPDGTTVKGVPDGISKAELATKLKANGMNVPDSWMGAASAPTVDERGIPFEKGSTPESRKTTPEPPESIGQELYGAGEAALNAGASAITAPIGALAEGIAGGRNPVSEQMARMSLPPTTPAGQRYAGNIGNLMRESGIAGLAPEMAGVTNAARMAAQDLPRIPPLPPSVRDIGSDLTGSRVAPARAAAAAEARPLLQGVSEEARQRAAVEEAAGTHEMNAATARAQRLDQLVQRIDQRVSAPAKNSLGEDVPNLHDTGADLRTVAQGAAEAWRDKRASGGAIAFPKAEAEAAAKEASGQYVQVGGIESDLKTLLNEAKGIPHLENEISGYLSAITGGKSKEPAVAPPTMPGAQHTFVPNVKPKMVTVPQPFKNLVLVSRFGHDVVNSGNFMGFSAIGQRAAYNMVKKLDAELEKFAPAYAEAKAQWAADSKPLADMNTRFGKVIEGTEGESSLARVSTQDLPGRILGKREGIEVLQKLLGNDEKSNATVDKWVENWILKDVQGETGKGALNKIQAPQREATLSAVPELAAKLKTRFETKSALEESSARLAKQADQARKRGELAASSAQKQAESTRQIASRIDQDLKNIDDLMKYPDKKNQQAAIDGSLAVLARERNAGMISAEKYKAAGDLISRANTLEARAARAQRIAKRIAGLGTVVFIGKEIGP